VLYNARTGLGQKIYEPQALYVGWFDHLYTYPTKIQNAVYTNAEDEGEQKVADGIQITTSDSASTVYDLSVMYRVKREDVFTAFKTFGAIPIEDVQSQHIRRAVREVASAVGTQFDVFEAMGKRRVEMSRLMTDELRKRLGPKGITVESVLLLRAYPNESVTAKITSQVNSNTLLAISETNSLIATIQKQIGITRATADAEAQRLTAVQTKGKSLELQNLDLMDAAVDKWVEAGGHLPTMSNDGKQTIVLGQDALQGAVGRQQR
jgi:hypothetical protein